MTRHDTDARAAALAATPWPSPPGGALHPQAAWNPTGVCPCDECAAGREAADGEHATAPAGQHVRRADLTTLALVESAARSTRHLAQRLGDLARALGQSDETEIAGLAAELGPEVQRTWSLLESVEVELTCRGDR